MDVEERPEEDFADAICAGLDACSAYADVGILLSRLSGTTTLQKELTLCTTHLEPLLKQDESILFAWPVAVTSEWSLSMNMVLSLTSHALWRVEYNPGFGTVRRTTCVPFDSLRAVETRGQKVFIAELSDPKLRTSIIGRIASAVAINEPPEARPWRIEPRTALTYRPITSLDAVKCAIIIRHAILAACRLRLGPDSEALSKCLQPHGSSNKLSDSTRAASDSTCSSDDGQDQEPTGYARVRSADQTMVIVSSDGMGIGSAVGAEGSASVDSITSSHPASPPTLSLSNAPDARSEREEEAAAAAAAAREPSGDLGVLDSVPDVADEDMHDRERRQECGCVCAAHCCHYRQDCRECLRGRKRPRPDVDGYDSDGVLDLPWVSLHGYCGLYCSRVR